MNPVVADLLRLRSAQNMNSRITPSIFYHPGPENTMADDASKRLDINDKAFLYFFYYRYSPQSAGSWIFCHMPTAMVSPVVCALHKRPSVAEICQTIAPLPSMKTGGHSAPTSASAISSITLTTQWSRSFKCLYTGSRMVFIPRRAAYGQTRFLRHRELLTQPIYWKGGRTPVSHSEWRQGSLTCA